MSDFYTELNKLQSNHDTKLAIHEAVAAGGGLVQGLAAASVLEAQDIDLSDQSEIPDGIPVPEVWHEGLHIAIPQGEPENFTGLDPDRLAAGCYICICLPWFGCIYYRVC